MIRPLLQKLSERNGAAWGTVLVVGAGAASDLPALRQLHARQVILVEAHPELARAAARRVDRHRNEEVWPVAMVPGAEVEAQIPFHVLSQARYHSVMPPGQLFDYLPGLQRLPTLEVAARPVVAAVTALGLGDRDDHLLVLDAPGQAHALLQAMQVGLLKAFESIVVCCSSEPLYESEVVAEGVIGLLSDCGFEVVMDSPEAIFPEQALLLKRNDVMVECVQLRSALKEAREEQATTAILLKSMRTELDDVEKAAALKDARIESLVAQADALQRRYDKSVKQLQAQADAWARASASREARDACLEDMQAKASASAEVLPRIEEKLAEMEGQAKSALAQSMQSEIAKAAEAAGVKDARIESLVAQADTLQRRYDESVKQLQAQADAWARASASRGAGEGRLKDMQAKVSASADTLSHIGGKLEKMDREARRVLNEQTKNIYRKLDAATRNAAKQVEAFLAVHHYFTTGEMPVLSTESHSWPVSPDFAQYLLELLEGHDYDAVIEFGSGFSTLVMAKAFAKLSPRRQGRPPVAMLSFDHLEKYYAQTMTHLRHAELADTVDLVLAPLQPWRADNKETYLYYDCMSALRTLSRQHAGEHARVLVVVDGPPGKTGKHARYPALPCVLSQFRKGRVDFLMDDYAREDEKEIVELWQQELAAADVKHEMVVRSLEKDACLLTVRPGGS